MFMLRLTPEQVRLVLKALRIRITELKRGLTEGSLDSQRAEHIQESIIALKALIYPLKKRLHLDKVEDGTREP